MAPQKAVLARAVRRRVSETPKLPVASTIHYYLGKRTTPPAGDSGELEKQSILELE